MKYKPKKETLEYNPPDEPIYEFIEPNPNPEYYINGFTLREVIEPILKNYGIEDALGLSRQIEHELLVKMRLKDENTVKEGKPNE